MRYHTINDKSLLDCNIFLRMNCIPILLVEHSKTGGKGFVEAERLLIQHKSNINLTSIVVQLKSKVHTLRYRNNGKDNCSRQSEAHVLRRRGERMILAGTVMNEEGLSHFIRQIGYIYDSESGSHSVDNRTQICRTHRFIMSLSTDSIRGGLAGTKATSAGASSFKSVIPVLDEETKSEDLNLCDPT
jgi:hypothetical protein